MDPRNPHRDDLPMDVAEDIVAQLKAAGKERYGKNMTVKFVGDMTEEDIKMPNVAKIQEQLFDHLARCFVDGLCHLCKAQFPGKWPPTDDDNDGDSIDLLGWDYVDQGEETPPIFTCPSCSKLSGVVPVNM